MCFIQVLNGVVGLQWVPIMGHGTQKVENHCSYAYKEAHTNL